MYHCGNCYWTSGSKPKIRRTTMATAKHYVEYMHNVMGNTTTVKEIPERDVDKVEIPKNCLCFGFRFFDRTEVVVDGKVLTGEKENVSGWYYFGELLTIEQLKEIPDKTGWFANLIRNMELNGFKAVVKTKQLGLYVKLCEGDMVI